MVHRRLAHNFRQSFPLYLCAMYLLTSWPSSAQGETAQNAGYTISAGGIVVNRAEQWEKWTRPKHAVEIDPIDSRVTPRRIRQSTNAIADIDRFQILIGDEKAYSKLLKDLNRQGRSVPLNIRTAPASVAGVPIVHLEDDDKKSIKAGDPIIWYSFHGGIRGAFTSPESSFNILDGDLTTYWEPSTEVSKEEYETLSPAKKGPVYYFVEDESSQERRVDWETYEQAIGSRRRIQYNSHSLENWYVDVELGRVVPVSKIVLRFAGEGQGEPFRQFRILATPFQNRDAPLSLIARTTTPNVDRHVVEFDLDPYAEGKYQQMYLLRIAITDSKFDKFREVSREEYFELPVEDQGSIDYHIVNAVGGETRVDKEIFDQVNPERQGRLVYYQRERPRLADIEVWSQGDNIALGFIDGGGTVDLSGSFGFEASAGFDGLYDTDFLQLIWFPEPRFKDKGLLTLDLGAVFWLTHCRMVGSFSSAGEIVTRASDGTRLASGNLKWTEIDRRMGTGSDIEKGFEHPLPVRYLSTQIFSDAFEQKGSGDLVREFQLFGEGFPREITLTSPLIELPRSFVLGSIEWEADIPDSDLVDVQLRTRTGDRLVEITEYYGSAGEPMTQTAYERLPKNFQGAVVTRIVPGGGWSSWSQRYLSSGERVASPSPRRFLQIQVKLLSESPDLAGSIRSVRVHFLTPVARRTLAEIWPNDVTLGIQQDFELYLNPTFVEQQPNGQPSSRFDEILLDASPIQKIELLDVRVGAEEDLQHGTAQNFTEVGWRLDPASREKIYWFEDTSGERFQALIDPDSGDTLKVVQGRIVGTGASTAAPRLLLHLPRKIAILSQAETSRIYNRVILAEGEEVPVDENNRLLNEITYLSLPEEQQGRVLYFTIVGNNPDGTSIQAAATEFEYWSLADSLKGSVRYFRKLVGKGGEFPFDRDGNPLSAAAYNALPTAEKGSIMASGELVQVHFEAEVLLNGTTINAAIRDSNSPESWQQVDPGDATSLTPGAALSISVPLSFQIIQDISVVPNPFTPNADGINDQTQIRFSIGNLNTDRKIRVQIYDLSGRRIWQKIQASFGDQSFVWEGQNETAQIVPPGLYLCKIEVDVDAETASHETDYRLIAVVY